MFRIILLFGLVVNLFGAKLNLDSLNITKTYLKTCNKISLFDLKRYGIIKTDNELKDVLFLNDFNTTCTVINKPNKELKENYVKRDIYDFKDGEYVKEYSFNTRCIYLTKQNLVDNFILKENEDNRNLKYNEVCNEMSKDKENKCICTIKKYINKI